MENRKGSSDRTTQFDFSAPSSSSSSSLIEADPFYSFCHGLHNPPTSRFDPSAQAYGGSRDFSALESEFANLGLSSDILNSPLNGGLGNAWVPNHGAGHPFSYDRRVNCLLPRSEHEGLNQGRVNTLQSNGVLYSGGSGIDYGTSLAGTGSSMHSLHPLYNHSPTSIGSSSSYPSLPSNSGVETYGGGLSNGDSYSSKLISIRKRILMIDQQVRQWTGRIWLVAKDQDGSRLLQNCIQMGSRRNVDVIFAEVINSVGDLSLDPFGTSVIQSLVMRCNESQRIRILSELSRDSSVLLNVCKDPHGSRVMQAILQHLRNQDEISRAVQALSSIVLLLTKYTYGNHVIQRCLEVFPPFHTASLLSRVADNCYEIATDKQGCCVLQHCIQYSTGEVRRRLINQIINSALPLSENIYGNYVVQYAITHAEPLYVRDLMLQLRGSFSSLSCNKYGSHVVQRCLTERLGSLAGEVINELVNSPDISLLFLDPFGNYVVQSALEVAQGSAYNALLGHIRSNYSMMCSNKYGKKVLEWFNKQQGFRRRH